MQFSEPTFLLLFLPLLLAVYYGTPNRWVVVRNLVLFFASFAFAFWAGRQTILILIGALFIHWVAGIVIEHRIGSTLSRAVLVGVITTDLAFLAWCKYGTFINQNLNVISVGIGLYPIQIPRLPQPPGISFFTFIAIAYVVDVYRTTVKCVKSPLEFGQFFLFFPRLMAGPIVRIQDFHDQLKQRCITRFEFAEGVRRFIIGLGKKVLIANTVGGAVDGIFGLQVESLSCVHAWVGVVCYAIQIYFDFSGYTDMAIGLGALFGFRLPENFNYPYVATSIREFWRRWHMTLSSWLRDYLYIPLGGSRCNTTRAYFNLVLVFFLCGLWHGANWTFIVWGVFQGMFLVFERLCGEKRLQQLPLLVRHLYALFVVLISWVFFRSDNLSHAFGYLESMFGFRQVTGVSDGLTAFVDPLVLLALIAGIIGSFPIVLVLRNHLESRSPIMMNWLRLVALIIILVISIMQVAVKTYQPFIYFQF